MDRVTGMSVVAGLMAALLNRERTGRGRQLEFSVSNSIIEQKGPARHPESSGIGLENTRKRLDLLYGKKYTMNISDAGGIYEVRLILPL